MGEEFFSQSPLRHRLYIGANYSFMPRWFWATSLDYRYSDYADPHVLGSSAGFVEETRQDHRITLSNHVSYEFTSTWRAFGKVHYQNNRSSINLYDYERAEAAIGLEHTF